MGTSILIADDDPAIRRMMRTVLAAGHVVTEADEWDKTLHLIRTEDPAIVLMDALLPGGDGFELLRTVKRGPESRRSQFIVIAASTARREMDRAFAAGADDYLVKPIDARELRSRVNLHMRIRQSIIAAGRLQERIDSSQGDLKRSETERMREIVAVQDVALFTLAKVAESRDNETGMHLIRMREYAQILAEELRGEPDFAADIDDRFLEDLYRSSPLHDLGKVGVPDSILMKPGKLTPGEFEIMKRHANAGANILQEAVIRSRCGGFMAMAAVIARSHHERWDGEGYPAGLLKEEIPLAARIVAVADVFDALTSARPYKEAWPVEKAKRWIEDESGKHFDPRIVAAFLRRFDDILAMQAIHADASAYAIGAATVVEAQLAGAY